LAQTNEYIQYSIFERKKHTLKVVAQDGKRAKCFQCSRYT